MKLRLPLLSALAVLLALPARAQESTTNAAPSAELITPAETTVLQEPALEPGEEPLPQMNAPIPGDANLFGQDLLGPGTGEYAPRDPQIPPRPPVLEDPLEKERKMRIRLRQLKAGIERDPRIVQLQEMADAAPTPEDRRAARRAYYTLFFDQVRRADPSLKAFADKLERQSLGNLFQRKVEPTWPLQPPPEPQPSAKLAAQLSDPLYSETNAPARQTARVSDQ
ncbi:MAG: hypothetical protein ACOYOL_06095 [Chthoniobacterales bacterium]